MSELAVGESLKPEWSAVTPYRFLKEWALAGQVGCIGAAGPSHRVTSFERGDLQQLGVGQAVVRVGRADHDFNLTQPARRLLSGWESESRNKVGLAQVALGRSQSALPNAKYLWEYPSINRSNLVGQFTGTPVLCLLARSCFRDRRVDPGSDSLGRDPLARRGHDEK